jgi:large subunit ribosomal protein L10
MYSRSEKNNRIQDLADEFKSHDCFYIVDITGINVKSNMNLRRKCKSNGVTFKVAKNSLISLAMDGNINIKDVDKDKISNECLRNISGILFVNESYNKPGKIVKEFKKTDFDNIKLKCAYVNGDVFYGNEQLDHLSKLKSKNELIGDIILALKSGINSVVSGIVDSKNKISGIVEVLKKKE